MTGMKTATAITFVAALVLLGWGLNQGNTATVANSALVALMGVLLAAIDRGLNLLTQIRNSVSPPAAMEWAERSAQTEVTNPDDTTAWDGNEARYKGYTVLKAEGRYFTDGQAFSTFGKAKRHINGVVEA